MEAASESVVRSRALAFVGLFAATLVLGVVLLIAFEPNVQDIDAPELAARSDDARSFLIADYFFIVLYAVLSPLAIWRFGSAVAARPPWWSRLGPLLLVSAGVFDAIENALRRGGLGLAGALLGLLDPALRVGQSVGALGAVAFESLVELLARLFELPLALLEPALCDLFGGGSRPFGLLADARLRLLAQLLGLAGEPLLGVGEARGGRGCASLDLLEAAVRVLDHLRLLGAKLLDLALACRKLGREALLGGLARGLDLSRCAPVGLRANP